MRCARLVEPSVSRHHQLLPQDLRSEGYDEDSRLKIQAEPLHKLLCEPKRILLYDGGHAPAPEFYVPAVNAWLDETMGPVTTSR
jgi:hypothetical protein